MKHKTPFLFAVAILVPLLPAQTWSLTAHAPVAGHASVSFYNPLPTTSSSTLAIGPVAPGTYLAASLGSGAPGANVQSAWAPGVTAPAATLGFTVSTSSAVQLGLAAQIVGAGLDATLDFTLQAPQPVGGRLWVHFLGIQPTFLADSMELDVGADGTVEFRIDVGTADPGPVDLPLVIPSNGALIRVRNQVWNMLFSHPPNQASTSMAIEVQFLPGQPAVQSFDPTGAGASLAFVHGLDDSLTLTIGGPQQTPLLMVIGIQPVNIPILPTVTLLVSLDVVLYTNTITLLLPQLPSGTALYCQGLIVDAGAIPRSTNSVRTCGRDRLTRRGASFSPRGAQRSSTFL